MVLQRASRICTPKIQTRVIRRAKCLAYFDARSVLIHEATSCYELQSECSRISDPRGVTRQLRIQLSVTVMCLEKARIFPQRLAFWEVVSRSSAIISANCAATRGADGHAPILASGTCAFNAKLEFFLQVPSTHSRNPQQSVVGCLRSLRIPVLQRILKERTYIHRRAMVPVLWLVAWMDHQLRLGRHCHTFL